MLAGALFNRATDLITKAVELQALGIEIRPNDALMRQCGDHLEEALALGRLVLHRSGEEGIDELWGEPFKAFAFPIEDFYRSRYMKIAATMRQIDRLCDTLAATFTGVPMFAGVEPLIATFARAAQVKCETLHTDADIFEVWSSFVADGREAEPPSSRCSRSGHSLDDRLRGVAGPAAHRRRQGARLEHHPRPRPHAQERPRVPRAPRALPLRLGLARSGITPRAEVALRSRIVGESRGDEGASHGLRPEVVPSA